MSQNPSSTTTNSTFRSSAKTYAKYADLVRFIKVLEDSCMTPEAQTQLKPQALDLEEAVKPIKSGVLEDVKYNATKSKVKLLRFLNSGCEPDHSFTCCQRFFSSGEILFIPQKLNWVCGYRNIQMLLSALLLASSDENSGLYPFGRGPENLMKQLIVPDVDSLFFSLKQKLVTRESSFSTRSTVSKMSMSKASTAPTIAEVPIDPMVSFAASKLVNVPSIQRLIERSWSLGFDQEGGKAFFSNSLLGKSEWIGTVETVSLLRSFGIRAVFVDFDFRKRIANLNRSRGSSCGTDNQSNRKSVGILKAYKRVMNSVSVFPSKAGPENSSFISKTSEKCESPDPESAKKKLFLTKQVHGESGIQPLLDFCWEYFSALPLKSVLKLGGNVKTRYLLEQRNRFITPLYFQHQGHSRTIIGVERVTNTKTDFHKTFLLILDPLRKKEQIRRDYPNVIKTPPEKFTKTQYQVVFVTEQDGDRGIMSKTEMRQSMELTPLTQFF